ncbi:MULTISPECIES: abortive infection family protein [unclassified Herbaspirillum]|uniref:abortive infection family protein n=1 Tax=unclassified Herbaspirillum TaxID=2624150 RepID=UPI000E2FA1D1|nr:MULTISPECIES: abortive infection family protein [unclassified Herbaspirillum]RFB72937.1 hypothetical protein DZB54_00995 [Herbaspirillum sp. 3R-3a1]TFI11255.1 hypothetical protein E4P32_07185 [Herbaspirillum sp. 3R11]TFI17163.1 hypothetical protein E4P31_07180 [Herbaspirillum sp. 3R-11]TFI28433.1 hypothetical protein E4P30_07680 [Herbaspirillum sp. 3C11]
MAFPINDTIISAIASLIDDAKTGTSRVPTHYDISFEVERVNLLAVDPKELGQQVGKAKRVRAILSWALEHNQQAGAKLIELLLSKVKASGGFRIGSENYVGRDAIENAMAAFKSEGFTLEEDGTIHAQVLNNLTGKELTAALLKYAQRAQKGSHDAALVTGTGKDLLEATAAHVLMTKYGAYSSSLNFEGLLGQAYMALGLAVPQSNVVTGEPTVKALERALFQSALAVNKLRNKQGTGHGRPWLPEVTDVEAKAAIEVVGTITIFLLSKLTP